MRDFLSRLVAPIPGGDPFGADVNHDPGYERLKGEIGKLGDIDVDLVESLSFEVVSGKSKDIRAMAWLAYAALRKGDLGRLADVVCALVDYCEGSFEQVFPRRDGAKLAALRWLSEPRFTSQCPKVGAAEADAPHAARLKSALERLKPALEKRFPSTGAPFPSLLYRRVTEWEKMSARSVSQPEGQAAVNQAVDKANHPVISGKSANNGAGVGADTSSVGTGSRPATVVIKLAHGEYLELINCISRMGVLLKKFA